MLLLAFPACATPPLAPPTLVVELSLINSSIDAFLLGLVVDFSVNYWVVVAGVAVVDIIWLADDDLLLRRAAAADLRGSLLPPLPSKAAADAAVSEGSGRIKGVDLTGAAEAAELGLMALTSSMVNTFSFFHRLAAIVSLVNALSMKMISFCSRAANSRRIWREKP